MPNSVFHKPPVPARQSPLPPAGAYLLAFLAEVAQLPSSQERQEALRYLFRWYLLLEGKEEGRLSSEELEGWRGRFYALLPAELRAEFPWEAPASLVPCTPERPPYPRYHTPFRQYGFIAARAVDTFPIPAAPEMVGVFLQGLMQILRHQGERVEVETLAKHLVDLSGGRLKIPEEVIARVGRVVSGESARTSASGEGMRHRERRGKGRSFHRGRRR